jgi:MFS family permease
MGQDPAPVTNKPFYGWIVVSALSVAGGFTMAMGIGNFGVFVAPMQDSLDIGSAPFGLGLTARLIGFAASGPIIGRILDRYGARGPLSATVIIFGASVVALGQIQAAWHMIALQMFMGMLGYWGSSSLYFTVMASQWFIRKRGKAMSIMFVGFPAGIAVSAPITQVLIDAFGWRNAWAILGVTGAIVVLLIARLVLRNRPEDMGLVPDGIPVRSPATQEPGAGDARQPDYSWDLHDALRTGAFWRLAIAFGTVMLGMSAIGLFWVPYFIDKGFTPSLSAWALAAYATSQAGTSILLAPLVDRYQPRFLAMFGYASFVAAFLLMMNATQTWQLFTTAILGGAGVGSGMLLQAQMWPSYFGRANIGTIRGAAMPLTLAFSGVGSAATGVIFDTTGSYTPAWWAAIGGLLVGAALLVITPKPVPAHRTVPDPAEQGT